MRKITLVHRLRNRIRLQKNNYIEIGNSLKMSKCIISIKGENNFLKIGNNVKLRNVTFEILGTNCSIEIGDNCMIGHNSYLSAKEDNTHIIIGNDCGLSRNIKIMTSDGHPIFQNGVRINPAKCITIENHIWVGDNATILKGVVVGNNSVIGLNSLVTKSIPENCVAAGNPAKVIRSDIEWKI
jgi:acetyltransferase-like isoleucine patch superfamily enzyme